MTEEEQEPTAEAIKQRKKREKEVAKNAELGIEKFSVEVAGVFKSDLKRVMKEHGINNQQDIHQRLLRNLSPPTSIPPRGCLSVSRHLM
ncbi:hypothetical protein PMI27_000676 [Pseudomonas sp. GM41(2012)]|uniref:hypothetical protein n=1 Tax=Pseudomonas sp. (strain GM41(2012)) TaxID=1144708 RepID=UPI00026FD6D1|nr:hypothetical protein PMI27_000676 [Pseudomonas sp. GM41(2012)]